MEPCHLCKKTRHDIARAVRAMNRVWKPEQETTLHLQGFCYFCIQDVKKRGSPPKLSRCSVCKKAEHEIARAIKMMLRGSTASDKLQWYGFCKGCIACINDRALCIAHYSKYPPSMTM